MDLKKAHSDSSSKLAQSILDRRTIITQSFSPLSETGQTTTGVIAEDQGKERRSTKRSPPVLAAKSVGVSLSDTISSVGAMVIRSNEEQIFIANAYGQLLALQQASAVLADDLSLDYTEHLTPLSSLADPIGSCQHLMLRSIMEATKLLERVSRVARLVEREQNSLKKTFDELAMVIPMAQISNADLVAIASGAYEIGDADGSSQK